MTAMVIVKGASGIFQLLGTRERQCRRHCVEKTFRRNGFFKKRHDLRIDPSLRGFIKRVGRDEYHQLRGRERLQNRETVSARHPNVEEDHPNGLFS